MEFKFAKRMAHLKASEMRDFKGYGKTEVISFAGGLPAPEVFLLRRLKQ